MARDETPRAGAAAHTDRPSPRARAGADTWWCHYPAGGYRRPVEAAILRAMGARAGVPDIGIIQDGRAFWLELKSAKGRLSPAQIECHEALRAAGCAVATVSTVDAALAQLAAWGIKLRGNVQ